MLKRSPGNPLGASRNLAWLATLGFHLALAGVVMGGLAIPSPRRPPEPSPSLVLRLTTPPARPAAPAPKPADPLASPAVTPLPPPAPVTARPQPAPRTRPVAKAPPAPQPATPAGDEQPAGQVSSPSPSLVAAANPTAGAAASPAADMDEEARRRGMVETLATLLDHEKRYPLAARRAGLSGRVTLVVDFDAQGRPHVWRVERGDAPEVLGRAALEAMSRAAQRLDGDLSLLSGRQVRVPLHFILE